MILSTDNLAFGSKNMFWIRYFFPQQQAPSQIIFHQISEPNFSSATEILFQVAIKMGGRVKFDTCMIQRQTIQFVLLHLK